MKLDRHISCGLPMLMFENKGLVDEAYKDGSGSEHGIYQTYKLALCLYALQDTRTYYYGEEDNLFRSQGPDGDFHTGYDRTLSPHGFIPVALASV